MIKNKWIESHGFIDDEHYYSDEYLDLIKVNMAYFDDFGEKVKFVLENIDVYDNPNMGYTDRLWQHVRAFEELFTDKEFNFRENNRLIRMIDCYKDVKGKRHYVHCIAVLTKKGTEMYIYNKKKYKFCQMEMKNFVKALENGLVVHNATIPGLRNYVNQNKNTESR